MATEELHRIQMKDGVRLSAKLYLPDGDGPFPAILEALPYRKDDVTNNYEPEYQRLRDEGNYAVCRVDVRGTGSSEGLATDEYPPQEQQDLCEVIDWLATQPWSSGTVGMYGTSYSGFNSLQVAMERPPALKAIISIYATDSRYTDDVHLGGGAQRGIDLIDYPNYMVALNALPPTPQVFGEGWRDEWERRVQEHDPWVLTWLEHQNEDDYWMHGSLKADYSAIEAAVLLVAGWADGYHNMAFRTLEELDAPGYLLAGPWSHMSADNAIPGPHIDLVTEMIAWWDRWLRDDDASAAVSWPKVRAYMRRATPPEPDLATQNGEWWSEPAWPAAPERAQESKLELGSGSDEYAIRGDVGFYASIWCAATMPWGLPMDQNEDDSLSLTYEWPVDGQTGGGEIAILGHPKLHAAIRSTVPVTYLSAKLCDVFPDGTSALVARGILNLAHRDSHADPKPLSAGETYDIVVELDATSWIFEPGHTMRLSVATSDWPSSWAPPLPGTITLERDESFLTLPVLQGGRIGEPPVFRGPVAAAEKKGGDQERPQETVWKEEHDVLARERRVTVDYGYRESDPGDPIQMSDQSAGTIRVSTEDPGRSRVDTSYWITLSWPEATVRTQSTLSVVSDATSYVVHVELEVQENGETKWTRNWDRKIPRALQ